MYAVLVILTFESVALSLLVGTRYESWAAAIVTFGAIWLLAAIRSWLSVAYALAVTLVWGRLCYEFGLGGGAASAVVAAAAGVLASLWLHAAWFRRLLEGRRTEERKAASPSEDSNTGPRRVAPALADACSVLGVEPGSSLTEVRATYRRLIRECHPDRLRSEDEGDRLGASQRSRAINSAYDVIKRTSRAKHR